MKQLKAFMAQVCVGPGLTPGTVFNPWGQVDPVHDVDHEAPRVRAQNLERYLEARIGRARIALIAEAPSYAGAKFCGIAMCCERMMLSEGGGGSAFFEGTKQRTSRVAAGLHNEAGMLERTASIVWKTMAQAGVAPHEFVNWNAFAWHPHEPGRPLTNRTPTPAELQAGLLVLRAFIELFSDITLVAVGQVCQRTLASLGIPNVGVRHPSYGGAPEFRAGIEAMMSQKSTCGSPLMR